MNRLLVNTAMLVAVLWPAMSYADVPACKKLGCPDCSCVVGHPDIKDKINPALLDIKNVLVKYGIPPEAVEISMKGYSGEEKISKRDLADGTTASCKCGGGYPGCKWGGF